MNEVKKPLVPVIPRQVAEAIEWMQRKHSEYAPRDLPQIYSIAQANDGAHKSYGIIADYARSDGNCYFEAIVNGYEIEKSAEELAEEARLAAYERIRTWHAGLRKMERNDASLSGQHAAMLRRDTIDYVLTILGITIEGVNA